MSEEEKLETKIKEYVEKRLDEFLKSLTSIQEDIGKGFSSVSEKIDKFYQDATESAKSAIEEHNKEKSKSEKPIKKIEEKIDAGVKEKKVLFGKLIKKEEKK